MKASNLKKKRNREGRSAARRTRRLYSTLEICHLFDISKATLYRWEREGLISMPSRDWRNWRLYTTMNVEEIKRFMRRHNAT
jgi:DNA-binding transcriptional MerR regulator